MTNRGSLITHKNCLDGATAALIAEHAGITPIFVEPDRVLQGIEEVPREAALYLADVSIKPEQYTLVGPRIAKVLDHHQSALAISQYANVLVDMKKSGSHLFYDFAIQQHWLNTSAEWDRLIRAVERYDLWKPCREAGQNLNRLFQALGYNWYKNRFARGWAPYTPDEQKLLADLIFQERQYTEEQLARALKISSPLPIVAIPLTREGATNEIAHHLLNQNMALVILIKPDGRLSVRSDGRVNAAHLMERLFNGGGHARAAGGRLDCPGPYDPSHAHAVLKRVSEYLHLSLETHSG
ncbi:MAG TPA: phosphoesterase [Sulfobacillus sp.]|jgi:oligoribonuclease NrnB/cAMP/cGMP phosphodiesterase (DHH superfamily)|nr:phosphoesterase [Sulfobacillus sp.]